MPTTPNMGLITPDEDGSVNVWDVILNDLFDVVDAHDHTTGKGVRIPFATGVTISADTPWNSGGTFYAITGIKALDFQPQAVGGMATYAGALFMNSADNELYWRTSGGTNVKLTAGTSINAALIGGIGGDYASVSALVDYVDASDTYRMRQQTGGGQQHYAHVAVGDLDLYQFFAHPSGTAVPTNRVRLSSPAALAASYALTFPAALPGSTLALQGSAAGALSFSNTFATALTLNAGATVATAQNITLVGTADVKHGDRILVIPGVAGQGTIATDTNTQSDGRLTTQSVTIVNVPVPLRTGDRIKSVTFAILGNGVADVTSIAVNRITTAGVATDINIGTTTVTNPAAVWADVACDCTDTTLAAGDVINIAIGCNAAALHFNNFRITYDRP